MRGRCSGLIHPKQLPDQVINAPPQTHLPSNPTQHAALQLMPETGKRVMRQVLFESRAKALAEQAAAPAADKAAPAGVAVSAVSGSAAAPARRRK